MLNTYPPLRFVRVVETVIPAASNNVMFTPPVPTLPILSLSVSSVTLPEIDPRGAGVGPGVGFAVGVFVGPGVGVTVGLGVGRAVSCGVGLLVGTLVG